MTPAAATATAVANNNNNMGSGVAAGGQQFGDTTYTKVFVGGLAWETQKDTMKKYFEQFGEILEAVVITDKATGRSKGYGFVTFKEAEGAMRACVDASPVIDGRRANCNLAFLGVQRSKPSTPKLGGGGGGRSFRVMSGGYQTGFHGGLGAAFPSAATSYPHYAIQQGVPFNLYGYSAAYSPDYSYPTNYYGLYGGATAQYAMYSSSSSLMNGGAAAFYPTYHHSHTPAAAHGHGHGHNHSHHLGEAAVGASSFSVSAAAQNFGVQYPHPLFHYSALSSNNAASYQHYAPPMSLASSPALQSGVTMAMALAAPMPHR